MKERGKRERSRGRGGKKGEREGGRDNKRRGE